MRTGVTGLKRAPPVAPGTTAIDATDELDVPAPFVAVDVKVYDVPFVRPVTVHEPDAPVTVHCALPGFEVTVYEVGVPPEVGATTVTVAELSPATAVA
jgi:hypothetical protein